MIIIELVFYLWFAMFVLRLVGLYPLDAAKLGGLQPPNILKSYLNFSFFTIFGFFRSMENMAWDAPKWGWEDLFSG